jgi:hypothetical protein
VDPALYRRFLSMFEYDRSSPRLCFASSYFAIAYTECPSLAAFSEGRAPLRAVATPPEVYRFAYSVTEGGFFELLRHGPLFAAFDLGGCRACAERGERAQQAAARAAGCGSAVRWCIWDVGRAQPTFRQSLQLPVPSLWYFPSLNLTEAEMYPGGSQLLPMVRWAHAHARDFDLAQLLEQDGILAPP